MKKNSIKDWLCKTSQFMFEVNQYRTVVNNFVNDICKQYMYTLLVYKCIADGVA